MSKRKKLGNRVRFEVFKRDSFTCQYCGRKAPDVVLEADHIRPVSGGGSDETTNLVTSCFDCNSGKSDKPLGENSAVLKQQKQLELLQERREQLDMMLEWKQGLADIDGEAAARLAELWYELAPGWTFNAAGMKSLRALVTSCGVGDVADAMRQAAADYIVLNAEGDATNMSWGTAWDKAKRIAKLAPAMREKPYLRDVFYVRAILKNRLSYVDLPVARNTLEQAMQSGIDKQRLKTIACDAESWNDWQDSMRREILAVGNRAG
jgi:hypothetical protein